jgi:alanine racemase
LWGQQGNATLSVEEVASWQDSIPYEVLTRLGKRVPRRLG